MQRFWSWFDSRSAVQEVLLVWGFGFATLLIAFALFGLGTLTKLVATAGFLYLPLVAMRRRGEDYRDYGLTLRNWRQDLKWFVLLSIIIGPIYFVLYWFGAEALPHLPPELAGWVSPIHGEPKFVPRLPPRFDEWVIDQVFVTALPEEFFYRGYVQTRLRDAWPRGRLFLGVRLGPSFWLTALLFALGHLAIFEVYRLYVFIPALLFAYLRERTGTVMGAALLHAAANLFQRFLEVSFFGGPAA